MGSAHSNKISPFFISFCKTSNTLFDNVTLNVLFFDDSCRTVTCCGFCLVPLIVVFMLEWK